MRKAKYNAKKTVVDGIKFDSKREATRYVKLKSLERAGYISGLTLQKGFELIPEIREKSTIGVRGGVHKGKIIERASYYVADFVYKDSCGNLVVEDCKGFRTDVYKLKRKLMLYRYGIEIKET